ncbi:MAG: site-2 protease family protein [Chloroflexota bacterium]
MPLLGPIDLQRAFYMIMVLLIAITVHELAHAITADRLGDPTPREMGELSLNPATHMDQVGIMLLILTSIASFGFTYGRTHVTPTKLRFGPQRGNAIVAIVGPLSNLLLAAIIGVVLNAVGRGSITLPTNVLTFLSLALSINVLLFIINLIPVPPLDGFSVLGGFLSARQMYALAPLQQWGPLVILVLFVFDPLHVSSRLISLAMNQILQILCSACTV